MSPNAASWFAEGVLAKVVGMKVCAHDLAVRMCYK